MTNITLPRAVVEQALEALEYRGNIWHMNCPKDAAITALREALEQPQQTVCMAEYKRLQDLVTSQGIRLMEYESEQPQQGPMCICELTCVCGAVWKGEELVSTPPQRKPQRTVTYVCPVCAASLERQE